MATAKPAQQNGNEIVVTTAVELIGVSLLTLLAGANDQMGTIMVIVMVGFLFGWLLLNTTELGKIVSYV